MNKFTFWSVALMFFISACSSTNQQNSLTSKNSKMVHKTAISNKQKAIEIIESLATKSTSAVKNYISAEQYTQHNPDVGDGQGQIINLINAGLIKKAEVVRCFQDGDYVVAHSEYDFFGPKVGFDIFKFEDGVAVEHWDNLTAKSDTPNPSGHFQLDGPTEITDLDKTEANKAIVKDFVQTILVAQNYDQMPKFFDGDHYIQHNTQVPDGLSGLGGALKALADQGIYMIYKKNHQILGQGNFVLTVSEGSFGDKPTAFYDLFRVENGKIAEHWDVMNTIDHNKAAKNNNGLF